MADTGGRMALLRETKPPPEGCSEMNFSACQRRVFPHEYFRDSAKRNRSRRTLRSWSSRKIFLGRAGVSLHFVTMVSSRKPFDAIDGRAMKSLASGSPWILLIK